MVRNTVKGEMWMEVVMGNFKELSSICLEGLKEKEHAKYQSG
jgi:hypothetical protein